MQCFPYSITFFFEYLISEMALVEGSEELDLNVSFVNIAHSTNYIIDKVKSLKGD